jgi:hypothetical protein
MQYPEFIMRYNINVTSFIEIRLVKWLYVLQTLEVCILKLFPDVRGVCVCVYMCVYMCVLLRN